MRCTSTRVLPEPAPASTSRFFTSAVTACRWWSLSESMMCVTSMGPAEWESDESKCESNSIPVRTSRPEAGSRTGSLEGGGSLDACQQNAAELVRVFQFGADTASRSLFNSQPGDQP